MGIQDLTKLIKSNTNALSTVKLSDLQGMTIAIDISIYLNKYIRSVGVNDWLTNFVYFLITLRKYKIKLVCIFDGKHKPMEKMGEQANRRDTFEKISDKMHRLQEIYTEIDTNGFNDELFKEVKDLTFSRFTQHIDFTNNQEVFEFLEQRIIKLANQTVIITDEMQNTAREIIEILGITQFTAHGEAEALASYLYNYEYIDAILTEDTDVLCYGTKVMFRNLDIKNESVEIIDLDIILEDLDINFSSFMDLCILLSCDYNKRIKGNGVTKVLKLIKEHKNIEHMNFTKEELEISNFKRCRELFSIQKLDSRYKKKFLNKNLDLKALENFIVTNKLKISFKTINDAFSPKIKLNL